MRRHQRAAVALAGPLGTAHEPVGPGHAGPAEPAGAATILERLVDRALAGSEGRAAARTARIRRAHPGASPADVIALLERDYRRQVRGVSALVGLSAAVPGVGTGVAVALTVANVGTYLRASTTFVAAVTQVHGIPVADVARRRGLALGALLGADGARAVQGQLGVRSLYWGRGLLTRLPLGTVRMVNRGLARRVVGALGAKGGVLALGRLAPFGVGAVIGWTLGGRLARQVITGTRDAFGPPPADPQRDAANPPG